MHGWSTCTRVQTEEDTVPALKPIRRSQLISPFGIGAMVDFPGDESLMTAGLDAWPLAQDACPPEWQVVEERLQARLGVSHFRLPPEFRDPGPGISHPGQSIPFVRFPRWHYCPRRGVMEYLAILGGPRKCVCRSDLDCHALPERRKPFLIPVRIVAICGHGHIQDFPFIEWAHRGRSEGIDHRLRFLAGRSSASLAGIRIECSCGKSETLAGAFDFDPESGGRLHRMAIDCGGNRPWLGESGGSHEPCDQHLRVVQRGATNVYFPEVRSSIYLPLWAENAGRDIVNALENPRIWTVLTGGLEGGQRILRERCEVVAGLYGLDVDALQEAAQRRLDGEPGSAVELGQTEEEFRRQEYDAVRTARGGVNTDLLVVLRDPGDYGQQIRTSFAGVALARKLRETRALAGFTRLLPPDGGGGLRLQPLKLDPGIDWVPAIVVRGEGIFLELHLDAIGRWLARGPVARRVAGLASAYNDRRIQRGQSARPITPKFVLMHTLAHTIVTQLSFDCGYGSSALRERLYCDLEDPSRPMQGILIYTASGDSEGTLGGLVRQGMPDRLDDTIERALRRAQWCSSDPVCIESAGQGIDNANLAACHGCVLLPETSCEEGNRLLDRAMLVGTPREPQIGFFARMS